MSDDLQETVAREVAAFEAAMWDAVRKHAPTLAAIAKGSDHDALCWDEVLDRAAAKAALSAQGVILAEVTRRKVNAAVAEMVETAVAFERTERDCD